MAKGGFRPGSGRPKGRKDNATLEKEAVLKAFRGKVMADADALYIAQRTLAKGLTYLYKIEKEKFVGPKGGISYKAKPPKLVTSQWEIEAWLSDKVSDVPLDKGPEATYYYLTTEKPSSPAIDSLLDRTFGKAVQAVELGGPNGKPLFGDEDKAKSKQAISEYLGANIGKGRKS